MQQDTALIIIGPTASGKTQLSEIIQSEIDGEIINADVGQFYTYLSVGTAKPNLKNVNYKHHLFDILNTPEDLNVVKYRQLVNEKVKNIFSHKKVPIIVGGSLFYVKSLFFPPIETDVAKPHTDLDIDQLSDIDAKTLLQKIDPDRAKDIHCNDTYRIRRALHIWQKTGEQPSKFKPTYLPLFNAIIVFICPATDVLMQRIKKRTIQMIRIDGWIEEIKSLQNAGLSNFVTSKNFIGYQEILEWLTNGAKNEEMDTLIDLIQTKTYQYAKRQRTFWHSFKNQIETHKIESNFSVKILEIDTQGTNAQIHILNVLNGIN